MALTLAPIVLFVYNRPWHTEQTLHAIMENELADQSILYIYADGPNENATREQLEKIEDVRKVIRTQKWCKEVIIRESDKNKGLANSIIDATTEIVDTYGKVITLEDDVIAGRFFLKYMNEGLDLYQEENNVFMISGYNFPVQKFRKRNSSFFLRYMTSQAWATWKRAWTRFDRDAIGYEQLKLNEKLRREFNLNDSYNFSGLMEDQMEKKIVDSWAIRFYWTLFNNQGLILYPDQSLIKNIGWDGSGTHSNGRNPFGDHNWQTDYFIEHFPKKVKGDKAKLKFLADYLRQVNGTKQIHSSALAGASKKGFLNVFNKIKSIVPQGFKQQIKKFATGPTAQGELAMEKMRAAMEAEQLRLQNLPRFTETDIDFLDKKIQIVDIASFNFLKKEIFDQEIYRFNTDTEEPYIVDCGANIGLSVIYFKQLYPNARIVAFEPDDRVFTVLQNNVETFNLSNVELIKKACWDVETTLEFYSEGADGGRVAMNFDKEQIINVKTIRLRKFLERKVDFLKIDIEGAELRVLADCSELLPNVDRIFVEYHSFIKGEQELPEILNILKEAGFRFHITAPNLISVHPYLGLRSYANMDNQINIFANRL